MKRSPHPTLLLLATLAAGACDSPTAPRAETPETVVIDWTQAVILLADPMLQGLPGYLMDDVAAVPLRFAVGELEAAVAARDADRLKDAIERVAAFRVAYLARPGFNPGDLPILIAIELFELRAPTLLLDGNARLFAAASARRGAENTTVASVPDPAN